ncbi:inactive purple acid phosphatase-like protein [Gossypium australe]|uniref:Inactive purple acid phosphatase-like protein n=1 Tax=Gossypium australe TaxID=47621 RepID=A0A5B6VD58_9ROSI|nr:inactive purple acid phosphatase-like protein [Gossypium australe]
MSTTDRGFATLFEFNLSKLYLSHGLAPRKKQRICFRLTMLSRISCCYPDPLVPIRRGNGSANSNEKKGENWRLDSKNSLHKVRVLASPAMSFASAQYVTAFSMLYFFLSILRMTRLFACFFMVDTGIANEEDWGISLLNENVNESGTNEDGSTWYQQSGEDLGENGYLRRWTMMGGKSHDGSSEWMETWGAKWWETSDWSGYKELGVEKSGRNAEGDSWWETWQELLHQDEWSNLAHIEKSAQKQAKSGIENAGWHEKWWEKYDAKGWTEKGAHKYGRLNEQSWWEKWGEHYDGRGSVLKWTDKWAKTEVGTRWGDKWEEKFFDGVGSRQGETWHVSASGNLKCTTELDCLTVLSRDKIFWEDYISFSMQLFIHPRMRRPEIYALALNKCVLLSSMGSKGLSVQCCWSRTWGEEHFGNGKVHKYGKSTTGESWDLIVHEETYYEAEPHYGWADVVGDSSQLLTIQPRPRPPGVFPNLDFGSSPPQLDDQT